MTAWRARLAGAVVVAILAAATGLAGPAQAHSKLVSSSPVDGAVLAAAPSEVVFTFDEDLLPGVDTIAVSDADGNVVTSVKVEPEGNVVRAPWPTGLPDGTYQAAYRIVSGDGHPVTGAILVTLDANAPASVEASPSAATSSSAGAQSSPTDSEPANPAATASTSAEDPAGSAGPLVVGAVIVVLLAGLLAWWAVRRRGRGSARSS